MKIEFKNMLEVVTLISALEERLEWEKENSKLGFEALMNVYNQVKETYKNYLNFKF